MWQHMGVGGVNYVGSILYIWDRAHFLIFLQQRSYFVLIFIQSSEGVSLLLSIVLSVVAAILVGLLTLPMWELLENYHQVYTVVN